MVAPRGVCMVAPRGMHGCSRGGMHGCLEACMVAPRGACMVAAGGHAWLLPGGACVVAPGGGGMRGIRRDTEIRSMSGRYASYWNAFLLLTMVMWCIFFGEYFLLRITLRHEVSVSNG